MSLYVSVLPCLCVKVFASGEGADTQVRPYVFFAFAGEKNSFFCALLRSFVAKKSFFLWRCMKLKPENHLP
jgi:hypothetical protein